MKQNRSLSDHHHCLVLVCVRQCNINFFLAYMQVNFYIYPQNYMQQFELFPSYVFCKQ